MTIRLHRGDLPDLSRYKDSVAIDTETMGLNPHRDRLCVVQMSNGDGSADVIQIPKGHTDAPNLKALLANPDDHQDLSLRAVRSRGALQRLRRDAAAGLLHQDRLAADPHLYRPAWPEGSGARGAQHRPVEAAAVERLGLAEPQRGAARLCRFRRAASAWLARAARCHAGARGPHRAGAEPVSTSCRPGPSSISAAGRPRTSSRIREPRTI